MAQLTSASNTTSRLAILFAAGLAAVCVSPAQAAPSSRAPVPKQRSADSDEDGLSDARERELRSNPSDRDSDDDGWLDGEERDPGGDADGDGLINILDPDSDNDGLWDGLEVGNACADPDTRRVLHTCKPDSDSGDTQTDPLDPDTDGDGRLDGEEDSIHNGIVDYPDETDPNNGPRTGGSEPLKNDDALQGGGFACSASHAHASGGGAITLLSALAIVLGTRRRRR